ncbi:hypothetical protein QBC43DRAFT_30835 [Cladorrhinum sp. PSN259]|nr:hypothetical protein QBC43DRAFT_30835 [Cladorrhinum sp. PSN259]
MHYWAFISHGYWYRVSSSRTKTVHCVLRKSGGICPLHSPSIILILLLPQSSDAGFRSTKPDCNKILDNRDNNPPSNAPSVYDGSSDDDPDTIQTTQRKVKVLWEDSTHQIQVSDLLDMDFYVSPNQALFTLHCAIFSKNTRDSHINMFIYPEDVKSITCEDTYPNVVSSPNISLRFIMSKLATLEIPTEFKPKTRSLNMVQTLRTLASIKDFTVYIDTFNLAPGRRDLFCSLPSVFSRYHLKTSSTQAAAEQLSPPPYQEESPSPAQTSAESNRKRRLGTDSPPQPVAKRILHTLDEIIHRVDRLEDMAPCRFNSEEFEGIMHHVNETLDHQLAGVQVDILEIRENTENMQDEVAGVEEEVADVREEIKEVAGIRKRTVRATEIREEVAKVRQEVVEMRQEVAEMRQGMEQARQEMRQEMEQTRQELRQQMEQTLQEMLNVMMSGARSGGNEKAKVLLNAESQASDNTQ